MLKAVGFITSNLTSYFYFFFLKYLYCCCCFIIYIQSINSLSYYFNLLFNKSIIRLYLRTKRNKWKSCSNVNMCNIYSSDPSRIETLKYSLCSTGHPALSCGTGQDRAGMKFFYIPFFPSGQGRLKKSALWTSLFCKI